MQIELILATTVILSITGGILFARISHQKKERKLIRERLDLAFNSQSALEETINLNIRKERSREDGSSPIPIIGILEKNIRLLTETAVIENGLEKFKQITAILFFLPIILALALDLSLMLAIIGGLILACLPYIFLLVKAAQTREKFINQLPEATELIVSVLRTGHSVPRAIKTVSEEIPAPLGTEFRDIHQRLNLGQQLSEALAISSIKYDSHELDLIRRAVAIQAEVGGSLAELLDKTNNTLRQRLKLARHVKVLTSQSRLTGIIVGMLPILLALVLNYLKPGYLDPLFNKEMGRMLLLLAIGLQIVGILIMRKLSTVKI